MWEDMVQCRHNDDVPFLEMSLDSPSMALVWACVLKCLNLLKHVKIQFNNNEQHVRFSSLKVNDSNQIKNSKTNVILNTVANLKWNVLHFFLSWPWWCWNLNVYLPMFISSVLLDLVRREPDVLLLIILWWCAAWRSDSRDWNDTWFYWSELLWFHNVIHKRKCIMYHNSSCIFIIVID